MTTPTDPVTTKEAVTAWLQVRDDRLDPVIDLVVPAVDRVCRGLRIAQVDEADPPVAEWPDDVKLGATMLAARLVRRRESPSGVEALTAEGAAYVSRNDPDIAQLLQLGDYAKPSVG